MRTERSIQLSYGAVDETEAPIGAVGLEPTTYGFKVRCSTLAAAVGATPLFGASVHPYLSQTSRKSDGETRKGERASVENPYILWFLSN